MSILKGTIEDVKGTWQSGLIEIHLVGGEILYGDSGPTVRALDSIFPGFITKGHRVDPEVVQGQDIQYGLSGWGTIDWVADVDTFNDDGTFFDPDYEAEKDWI